MKVTLQQDDEGFIVWAMLDDGSELRPHDRDESFVIGVGKTKEDAVVNAIRDLEKAMEQADQLR